jgi:hypothetical protein
MTIHEVTRNCTKKGQCFVTLRVTSWIVRETIETKRPQADPRSGHRHSSFSVQPRRAPRLPVK